MRPLAPFSEVRVRRNRLGVSSFLFSLNINIIRITAKLFCIEEIRRGRGELAPGTMPLLLQLLPLPQQLGDGGGEVIADPPGRLFELIVPVFLA